MEKLQNTEELIEYISTMSKENSVCQVFLPGKGTFIIVLQEEDRNSIAEDIRVNPGLGQMIQESLEAYDQGDYMTTEELIKSLSPEDFK